MGYRVWGNQTPNPIPHTPFRYTEHSPSAEASRLILNYWSFQADAVPSLEEPYAVFPDGCASVALVVSPGAPNVIALVGPRVSQFYPPVVPGVRIWGIRFWPDAIRPALGLDPRDIRDHYGAAPESLGRRFGGLREALPPSDDPDVVFPALDHWASHALADTPDPDRRVRAAIQAIVRSRGEGAMELVARDAAVGLRQLQRLFRDATSLTLLEFARVRRLREALALQLSGEVPGWSRIAAGTGFVDHSHLTREFLALTGTAPTAAGRLLKRTAHRGVRP